MDEMTFHPPSWTILCRSFAVNMKHKPGFILSDLQTVGQKDIQFYPVLKYLFVNSTAGISLPGFLNPLEMEYSFNTVSNQRSICSVQYLVLYSQWLCYSRSCRVVSAVLELL